jgi:uncharacterized membrane protein
MNAFGFSWGGILMVLLLIALMVLVVILVARTGKARIGEDPDTKERGIAILTERFARGEIDAATFRSMKVELGEKA